MSRERLCRCGRAPAALLIGFAAFVAAIAYVVGSSLVRRTAPSFDPTPFGAPRPPRPVDTLTIDARDEHAWRFVDLASGVVRPAPDGRPWDIAVRRYHVIAAGDVADLGPALFDTVARAPAAGWRATSFRSDSTNPAIARWYRYGMMSHLLEPKGHVYAIRSPTGYVGKLAIVSYYCRGLVAGCLTIRFASIRHAAGGSGPPGARP